METSNKIVIGLLVIVVMLSGTNLGIATLGVSSSVQQPNVSLNTPTDDTVNMPDRLTDIPPAVGAALITLPADHILMQEDLLDGAESASFSVLRISGKNAIRTGITMEFQSRLQTNLLDSDMRNEWLNYTGRFTEESSTSTNRVTPETIDGMEWSILPALTRSGERVHYRTIYMLNGYEVSWIEGDELGREIVEGMQFIGVGEQ